MLLKLKNPSQTKAIYHHSTTPESKFELWNLEIAKTPISESKIPKSIYEKEDSSVYLNGDTRNISMSSSQMALKKGDNLIQDVVDIHNNQQLRDIDTEEVDIHKYVQKR